MIDEVFQLIQSYLPDANYAELVAGRWIVVSRLVFLYCLVVSLKQQQQTVLDDDAEKSITNRDWKGREPYDVCICLPARLTARELPLSDHEGQVRAKKEDDAVR